MQTFISNIQKYSIHDGTGIRTTLFFKGCPLACKWCHNPETQSYQKQISILFERCLQCGNCLLCPNKAVITRENKIITDIEKCKACGACIEECFLNLREISGKYYEVEELILECEKDKAFYEQSDGGITLSGGEVLTMDMDYIKSFVKKLYNKGYRINIDTCGYAPFANFQFILPYTDTFLYDLKCMDNTLHKKMTGVSNTLILNNLKKLSKTGAKIWIRIPAIGGVNDTQTNMEQTADFLIENRIVFEQVNLLPYHKIGNDKYKRFGKENQKEEFLVPEEEHMIQLANILKARAIKNVKIGG